MRILVTGGLGFIGSCFVRQGSRRFSDVSHMVVLDKMTYAADLSSIADCANRPPDVVVGDIGDYATVRELLARHRVDTVVNFAAETHVDRSIADYVPFIRSNMEGTCRLMHAIRDHLDRAGGTDEFRLLHVSSDEVYGDLSQDEARVFSEQDICQPNSPYAASKSAADQMVRAYSKTFGVRVAIVRPSNNYGPFQHPEKLIPNMVSLARQGKPLTVYGNGKNVREWTHVEDNCRAIWQVLSQPGAFGRPGQIFNIGSGEERTNNQIVDLIVSQLSAAYGVYPKISYVTDRRAHDRRYGLDSTLIRSGGWKPQVVLEKGIRSTVDWFWQRAESRGMC